ncbi:MAG: type II secretion system minor pseudopilin GspI [Pseudomonadota bacterium]
MARPAHGVAGRQAGFTLLEVLVAVAVLSLLSLASLRLAGAGVQSAQHVEGKTQALIVAENALVDVLLEPSPARGTSTDVVNNMGLGWTVRRKVTAMPDQRVLKVEVYVSSKNGSASLNSFKVLESDE